VSANGQTAAMRQQHWLPILEAELFAFPGSQYDDQIDSISQALNHDSASSLWIWRKLGEGW
jgi:phage terminase large subunit-like protein